MPYTANEMSYNPYDYNSPYLPGQSLPKVDESEMIDIGSLQRYSMIYCNNFPIGSCTNLQIEGTLQCKFHSCTAKLTDGTHCPNPSGPGSRYCVTGYHEENGRYPILQSPRSSFSQETEGTSGSQPLTACNSFENVDTAASQSQQQDHSHAQTYFASDQQRYAGSPTHVSPHAYQPQQGPTAQLQFHNHPQGARIQWTTQHPHSQPTYAYYVPDEGTDMGYQHVSGSAGSDSEWGTIEKRSL